MNHDWVLYRRLVDWLLPCSDGVHGEGRIRVVEVEDKLGCVPQGQTSDDDDVDISRSKEGLEVEPCAWWIGRLHLSLTASEL